MRQDQPALDDVSSQTVELLKAQLAAASDVFERMIASPCNVVGADFVMFDESCGQIARLMKVCCTRLVDRVQHLGGTADWPVRLQSVHASDWTSPALGEYVSENAFITAMMDALGQSLLVAAGLAEARGDGPTADLLTHMWRDIDRYLWQIVPQDVEIHLLLTAN